jgi:hypothetical protein
MLVMKLIILPQSNQLHRWMHDSSHRYSLVENAFACTLCNGRTEHGTHNCLSKGTLHDPSFVVLNQQSGWARAPARLSLVVRHPRCTRRARGKLVQVVQHEKGSVVAS